MSTMMNVPQLRFNEFGEDWEVEKFGNVFDRVTRKNKENNNNVLTISAQQGLINQKDYFNKSVSAKDVTGYYLLHKDDFAYNKSYSKGYPLGAIKRLTKYDKGVVSTLYICFNSKSDNVEFLEQVFNSGNLNREIHKIAQEGARNHGLLNISVVEFFKDIELALPSKQEQEKIASFLTSVDTKIEQLTSKAKLLQEYKKGVMQKIFSQEIRFGDDDESEYPEWDEKKLGELCSITTGKLDANAMNNNGKFRFYTCAKEYFHIDNYAFDTDALIISGNGANVGYIHHYNGKFNAYQRTYVLDKFVDNIIFIKYFLDKHLYKRIMKEKNEGNTPYIVMGTLTDMKINTPSLKEQTKIANFLSSIDSKIQQAQKQLDATKKFKKALLQQMFV